MFAKLKTMKPSSLASLLVLVVGMLIFANEFADMTNVSQEFSPFVLLLGAIFFIAGAYVLYKNKEIVGNKKSVIDSIVFLFIFSCGFYVVKIIFFILTNSNDPLFFIQMLFDFLIFGYGWRSNLAKLFLIGGLIYLIKTYGPKPEKKAQLEEEVANPVEQRQTQLSIGKWFWTIVLIGIPLVNLILLLVWGFGGDNPRKNFSLAVLLYILISTVIVLLIVVIAGLNGTPIY